MRTQLLTEDAWRIDVVIVRQGSHTSGERSALRRDEERGRLRRPGHGAHVDRLAFDLLRPEEQHVVRMRALAPSSTAPVLFSHFSAAVLHGLPVLWSRLGALHVTVARPALRSGAGVTGHVFGLHEEEVVDFRGLLATGVGRTVVDLAGAAPFEEGSWPPTVRSARACRGACSRPRSSWPVLAEPASAPGRSSRSRTPARTPPRSRGSG